jgi:hypothetical protein
MFKKILRWVLIVIIFIVIYVVCFWLIGGLFSYFASLGWGIGAKGFSEYGFPFFYDIYWCNSRGSGITINILNFCSPKPMYAYIIDTALHFVLPLISTFMIIRPIKRKMLN